MVQPKSESQYFATRAQQCRAFQRRLIRALGLNLTRKQKALIGTAIQWGAEVGAAEERFRVLTILAHPDFLPLRKEITAKSIVEVLGFQAEGANGAANR